MQRAVLSRFAFVRREGRRWLLESPLSHARIEVRDHAMWAMLEALRAPRTPRTLATASGVPLQSAKAMLALLQSSGFLTSPTSVGSTVEDADPSLVTWEFADLLLHSRSRMGRHEQPIGATFAFRDTLKPLPPVKRRPRGTPVRLHRPDMRALKRRDSGVTRVLETRRSARRFGERPIALREIGEFLFRTARVRRFRRGVNQGYEASSRPYPSGGACYPLELYLAVARCDGLRAGLHHYDPVAHAVTRVPRSNATAASLLDDARKSTPAGNAPQILVVITARFARVAWKYRSMAYATILKDVGVLLQTMYIVTTAMGLAGCAVGCGNVTVLADALGVPFQEESSVGEFLLGSQ